MSSLFKNSLWSIPHKQRLGMVLAAPKTTRVAPSPTGMVHIGTVRTALHNMTAAQCSGGRFLIRIDDTDQDRSDPTHTRMIFDVFDHLGVCSPNVYHQSGRRHCHQAAMDLLAKNGFLDLDQGAWRLNDRALTLIPDQFFDLASGVCRMSDTLKKHAAHIVGRSDGSPTFHLASVVDDIDLGVDLIIRGSDHLANMSKHIALIMALVASNYPGANHFAKTVVFGHVGLITQNGKKISKRDPNAAPNLWMNFGARAIRQWCMGLGWGHPDPQFDARFQCIDQKLWLHLFPQGGLRASNCDINLGKLDHLHRLWGAQQL